MRFRNFLHLYENFLLLEASKYEPMFAAIIAMNPENKGPIDSVINWARQTLQREDRVIWFLRWYRLMYIKIIQSWSNTQDPRVEQLFNKYSAEMAKFTGKPVQMDGDTLRTLQGNLSHFLSLPVPAIQQLQFSNQTVEDLIAQLQQIETQWKEEQAENSQYIQQGQLQEGDQKVLDFGDGWAWWLLPRGGCNVEAEAMGHCGNVPSQKRGDQILSLRKEGPRGWRPSLTFILHQDGMLGEMKGRGNDKPQPQYHPYIVKLLEDPMIKGIVGGGYLPEHNFSVSDLPELEQERLFELKPPLASAAYIYKKYGPTPDFVQKAMTEMVEKTGHELTWDETNKLFVVDKFDSVDDLVDSHGSDFAKRLSSGFSGGDDMFFDMDFDIDDRQAFELLQNLSPQIQMQVAAYAQTNYGGLGDEDTDWEDMDWQDIRDVWKVLVEHNDRVVEILKQAEETGLRYGAEAEAHKAFVSGLENAFDNNDPSLTVLYTRYTAGGKSDIQFDGPVEVGFTPEEAIQLIENPNILDDVAYNGWIEKEIDVEEPRYGFSGYDEDNAKQQAEDELSGLVA